MNMSNTPVHPCPPPTPPRSFSTLQQRVAISVVRQLQRAPEGLSTRELLQGMCAEGLSPGRPTVYRALQAAREAWQVPLYTDGQRWHLEDRDFRLGLDDPGAPELQALAMVLPLARLFSSELADAIANLMVQVEGRCDPSEAERRTARRAVRTAVGHDRPGLALRSLGAIFEAMHAGTVTLELVDGSCVVLEPTALMPAQGGIELSGYLVKSGQVWRGSLGEVRWATHNATAHARHRERIQRGRHTPPAAAPNSLDPLDSSNPNTNKGSDD